MAVVWHVVMSLDGFTAHASVGEVAGNSSIAAMLVVTVVVYAEKALPWGRGGW